MKVSFDFDDTLYKVIDKLIAHYEAGDEIYIVTTRMDEDMQEVRDFVEKYKLPVIGIYNTNFSWKRNTLKRLQIDLHYDDNVEELARIRHTRIKGRLVPE